MKTPQVVYSHKEVALMYFPALLPKSASARLTEWILRDPLFLEEMQQASYIRGQRLFTPLQFSILRYYLGDPEPVDWSKEPQKPTRSSKSIER